MVSSSHLSIGRLRSRLERWVLNWVPAYRGTGARVTFIAPDYSEVRIELPLSLRTRNIVGTIFGGSMYGAVDPIFMLMLMRRLGPDYIVWDKAATIRFRRPGRGTLHATFRIDAAEVDSIRADVARDGKTLREYPVDLVDAEGQIHASFDKQLSIRRKPPRPPR